MTSRNIERTYKPLNGFDADNAALVREDYMRRDAAFVSLMRDAIAMGWETVKETPLKESKRD